MRSLLTGFTTRAGCLLAAGLTAVVCGLLLGELDLVRAGSLAAALPVVASVVIRRSQLSISSRRSQQRRRVPAGEAISVQLWITNRSVLPTGALMLEDALGSQLAGRARFVLDGLGSRESRSVTYRIPGLRRGAYVAGPLRLRLTDPFGMVDLTRSFTATSTFMVTPVVEPLAERALPRSWDAGENTGSHSIGTRGADDASTREYRQGDDLRKIHWRTSARTGSLMVRHEERPWQGRTALLLDVRSTAHESGDPPAAGEDPRRSNSLEWAISCAASIGTALSRSGRETALITGGPGGRHPVGLDGLLDQLSVLRPSAQRDLTEWADALRAAGRDSTAIAVLGRLDLGSARALARVHPRGSPGAALAVALDVASWRDPAVVDPDWTLGVDLLRAAGWSVVAARGTDSVAEVWGALVGPRASLSDGEPR